MNLLVTVVCYPTVTPPSAGRLTKTLACLALHATQINPTREDRFFLPNTQTLLFSKDVIYKLSKCASEAHLGIYPADDMESSIIMV